MKRVLMVIVLLNVLLVSAQSPLKKGYYIDNNGNKTEGFIKDVDWNQNPKSFWFTTTENGNLSEIAIAQASYFQVEGGQAFRRFSVSIDPASDTASQLDDFPDFRLATETVFLRVLLSSEASLYEYVGGSNIRFYLATGNGQPELLSYKMYLTETNEIKTVRRYRQQLYTALPCADIRMSDIAHLEYNRDGLKKVVKSYNRCKGASVPEEERTGRKDIIGVSLRAGTMYSKLTDDTNTFPTLGLGPTTSFRAGIEAEYWLGINNSKWSLTVEPYIRRLNAEGEKEGTKAALKSTFINITFGARHYFYLHPDFALYLGAGFDQVLRRSGSYTRTVNTLEYKADILSGSCVVATMGFKFRKKVGIEFHYRFSTPEVSPYVTPDYDMGFLASYRFF